MKHFLFDQLNVLNVYFSTISRKVVWNIIINNSIKQQPPEYVFLINSSLENIGVYRIRQQV